MHKAQGILVSSKILKIKKTEKEIKLWVHPEGQVLGSLFLKEESEKSPENEQPLEVVNRANPFVVLRRTAPDEIRFYNRASIIRVEYEEPTEQKIADLTVIPCELHMMDGSLLKGEIREELPSDFSRLFDYLNAQDNFFLKLYTGNTEICLVNKGYIIRANAL